MQGAHSPLSLLCSLHGGIYTLQLGASPNNASISIFVSGSVSFQGELWRGIMCGLEFSQTVFFFFLVMNLDVREVMCPLMIEKCQAYFLIPLHTITHYIVNAVLMEIEHVVCFLVAVLFAPFVSV